MRRLHFSPWLLLRRLLLRRRLVPLAWLLLLINWWLMLLLPLLLRLLGRSGGLCDFGRGGRRGCRIRVTARSVT